MCRKQKSCTLIDENINLWDRYSPLRPYDWFDEELDNFCNAVEKFLIGSREESINIIEELRSKEMQEWYIEHAQVAGTRRNFILKKVKPLKTVKEKKRMPSIILERELNFRDGYRCRYCQRRILTKDFIKRFISKMDYLGFRKGPRNIDTHGILLIFYRS